MNNISNTYKHFSFGEKVKSVGCAKHLYANGRNMPSVLIQNKLPFGFSKPVSPNGPPSVKYLSLNLEENELLQVALLKNYCPDEKYSTLQKLIFPEESRPPHFEPLWTILRKEKSALQTDGQ